MLGTKGRVGTPKRARPKSFANVPPCVPASLRALRQNDQHRYERKLILFLRTNVKLCHPSNDIGWWCCYEEQMKDLVTFLSESQSSIPEFWLDFRAEVSNQLSLCRQCAIAYHKAVNEWELSNEVSQWSKGVIRKRVGELVEWDAHRLIPAIEKGAICARLSDRSDTLAARTQCREAFLESLLSLRLCMHENFCAVLGKVFRTRSPANNHEDVTPFITAHGAIPPGVAALCFHASSHVRRWAKSTYISCRLHLPPDEQALQLLISKGLRLALGKATNTSESHNAMYVAWAPDMQCLWEGIDVLLTSLSSDELGAMIKRNKKFPIIDAIYLSLRHAGKDLVTETSQGLSEVLSSLRYVLLNVRFASLFGYCSLTPENLLDALFNCFQIRSCNACERRLLLDTIFNITSSSARRGNKFDATSLFVKCFGFLENLECYQRTVSPAGDELGKLHVADVYDSRGDILTTGARLLHRFYWYSWPRLPVADSKRIADFVTKAVRGVPERECSWDLLRSVLLTDVFNLMRCIYEPREVDMIADTFFAFHADMSSTTERRSSDFESAIRGISRSQVSLTWVHDLWNNLKTGYHISDKIKDSGKVRSFELSLTLDLHRLVGALDPRRCGDLVNSDVLEQCRSQLEERRGEHRIKDLVSLRMETIHKTIVSRMHMIRGISDKHISLREFPFHAAHLLSSSMGEVSKQAHFLLQRKYEIQNATFAGPQSRDKLLVHILQQDKSDSRMVLEGFMSATRIMSAQGAAVSVRAYPSFFRWYSLLTSKDCRILGSGEIAKGALGVLLTFLENWKGFESKTSPEIFQETVCRLFATVPDIWYSLDDMEANAESKNEGRKDHFRSEVRPWVQKLTKKLFAMQDLRDELPRNAWVRMITQESLKRAFKRIDSYREILLGIIGRHGTQQGRLDYVQCRRLADAYDLEEANQILDRWAVNEARRTASHTAKASKNYRETKIDSFFSSATRPLELTERHTMSAPKEISDVYRLRRRITAAQKRHIGHCSSALTNGSLHGLRRDHRQARAEFRRVPATCGGVSEFREPTKTRFELLREERIAEKERQKGKVQSDGNVLHPSEIHSEDLCAQECLDEKRNESAPESPVLRINSSEDIASMGFCYPKARRELQARCLEQIKRNILMSQDPHSFEICTYTNGPPETFDDVESYVNYWEPLLIAEFRASLGKKFDEERLFAEQNMRDQENVGCRMVFEVDGPAEDIGYLHTLSITSQQRSGACLERNGGVGISPFDVSKVQVSDIVMLQIPGARQLGHDGQKDRSEVVAAIVSSVLRAGRELRLTLRVVFDNAMAPGKGRLLKVSKLLSFATLQRQLDALWSLPKMQDGVLWSLLDPAEGWGMKRDLQARDEFAIDLNSSLPQQVIQKMESLGILNASQGRAITEAVRSCSCLFASRGGTRTQYTKDNHGSVSLIQGPPGTGKTSTIIALLSALLSCFGSHPYRRKAKVILDGMAHILNIPAIRVLVCAPSNAAVDELMLRVMEDGLFTASENRVCPRLVRVGRGTTLEALKALEIHSLSKSDDEQPATKDSAPPAQDRDHHKLLEEVNRQIGELDGERRKIAFQLDKASNGSSTTQGLSRPCTEKFRELGEKLHILHDKKKLLHSILSQKREAERKKEASRRREDMKTICNTLATASVVFATLNSSGHEDMKTLGTKFDVVIIDEAGQSCEPEALIPITLSQHVGSRKQRFMHIVLVGDPKQLPATVISNNRRVATAMGRSLFERIGLSDPSTVHLLDTQYRMHPKISSFPSERFYGGLLRNSASVKNKNMHKGWHSDEQKRFGPLTFFDTAKTTTKERRVCGGSLSNDTEAKLVIGALISMVKLYRVENLVDSIVVLSPYKHQVLLLRRLISGKAELKEANVEVSTIDGIQGREKSVVLLSTVRSGHSKDIGFVKDDRRLNVALTRAKHTLMIFGHAEFLSTHSDAWASLIAHCRKRSQVISLTDVLQATFPESRRAVCPRLAKEIRNIECLSDIDDDTDVSGRPGPDHKDLRGTKSEFNVEGDAQESALAVALGGNGIMTHPLFREKSSLKEVNCDGLRAHHDGKDREKKTPQDHAFRHHGVVTRPDTSARPPEYRSGRSQRQDDAYDSTDPVLKRALPVSQPVRHLRSPRKQKGKDLDAHLIRLGSSSAKEQPFRPADLQKTDAKPTAQRPYVDTAAKPRAYSPLVRKSFIPQNRTPSSRRYGHSGEGSLSGASACGLQRRAKVVFEKKPEDRQVGRPTGQCNTVPKQARLLTTPAKRSFCSSHGSESTLGNEPPRKRSRQDRHGKQGAERRNARSRVRRHPEQNRADSYITQRRTIQTRTSFQGRRQTGQRLVTHHQNRMHQTQDRQARLPKPDVKHHSRANSRSATPSFSLADSQTKLKSTLDAARSVGRSGALR